MYHSTSVQLSNSCILLFVYGIISFTDHLITSTLSCEHVCVVLQKIKGSDMQRENPIL